MIKQKLRYLFKEEFLSECRYSGKLSDVTIRGYESAFNLFIKLVPEVVFPEDIERNTMNRFFRELETRERIVGRGKIRTGIKKSTLATYWSKLNKFFRWLKINKYLNDNPLEEMDYPNVEYIDKKYLQKETIGSIFNSVEFVIEWKNVLVRKRNVLIFAILLTCGLRKGELLELRNSDIDLERRQLTVRAENSKSRMQRVVPLNVMAISKLRDYFAEKRNAGCGSEYLLVSDNKGRFGYSGIKHLVEKIKKCSGLNFHLHQFRHTYAVNLLMNKTDIAKLKQLLGHRDIRMTASYLRCLPTEEMRSDVEALTLDNLV